MHKRSHGVESYHRKMQNDHTCRQTQDESSCRLAGQQDDLGILQDDHPVRGKLQDDDSPDFVFIATAYVQTKEK